MPTKRKPLPRLPARCPLCKRPVLGRLCRVCQRPEVFCKCTIGEHTYSVTERRARKTWLTQVAAKKCHGRPHRRGCACCYECGGDGKTAETRPLKCPVCKGTGLQPAKARP